MFYPENVFFQITTVGRHSLVKASYPASWPNEGGVIYREMIGGVERIEDMKQATARQIKRAYEDLFYGPAAQTPELLAYDLEDQEE